MIVTLDRLTITPTDVELPEACPECGQDFAEPSGLVEFGYVASSQPCRIVTERGVTAVSERETGDVIEELAFTTAFRCGGCRLVLVTGDTVSQGGGSMATKRRKHFDDQERDVQVETPEVDAYLEEVIAVGRKHGFSLSHEDSQGGFRVMKHNPALEEWLRDAADDTEVTKY